MSKRTPKGVVKRPSELSEEERTAREPVFDAFAEGVAPGGLRSKTDIKLLILFLLEQLEEPVPVRIISDVITDQELANYFEAMDAISELKESGNLTVTSVDGQDALAITEKGTRAVSYVEEDLPKSVRNTALATVTRFLKLDRHAKENAVEITPSGDGFNVCFSLTTGDTKLMELNMFVVSRDQAEQLKRNYLEDPTHLYASILTALMLD
ncbi:MAG: DUF4364 family protein [Clostridia bacterium]|nr:DUF4364 family protein [Clostridia bacterium]